MGGPHTAVPHIYRSDKRDRGKRGVHIIPPLWPYNYGHAWNMKYTPPPHAARGLHGDTMKLDSRSTHSAAARTHSYERDDESAV